MKNNKLELEDDEPDLEILKAVAQAWHGQSGSSRTANEFDARRLNFRRKPTRFNLEAMMSKPSDKGNRGVHWDFGQSLWDSYEILSVSKRLETGLVLDHQHSELDDHTSMRRRKRRKESKNSLRNLFSKMSSKRFSEAEAPHEEEGTLF